MNTQICKLQLGKSSSSKHHQQMSYCGLLSLPAAPVQQQAGPLRHGETHRLYMIDTVEPICHLLKATHQLMQLSASEVCKKLPMVLRKWNLFGGFPDSGFRCSQRILLPTSKELALRDWRTEAKVAPRKLSGALSGASDGCKEHKAGRHSFTPRKGE